MNEANGLLPREETSSGDLLNDAQKLHLRVSCQHMDKLLQDIEGILHATESASPFPRYRIDLSPAQGRVLEDYIRRFRTQLVRTLAWQRILPSQPEIPATSAISTHLHFVDIALADMRPSVMRGSGSLTQEAITELSGAVHELSSLSQNMMISVHQHLEPNLAARIDSLKGEEQAQTLLQHIEQVVSRRGMVEFRPRLDLLLSRIEDQSFEVALFGRVSSGKSSFLNVLLGETLLPVGINPITAVPTRIRFGTEICAFVRYGNGELVPVSLEEFHVLISEQGNPGNQRAVTRALLTLPSPRLFDGIVLVDTPGLGSLARRGTAETLAYLPSCDLGLVLIDAGNTLTAEDIGTLRLIVEAGIPALVLLSKSDLLQPDDVQSMASYIHDRIEAELAVSVPVHAVSSVEQQRGTLTRFFDQELQPRFKQVQTLRKESVMRKLDRLRSDLVVSLQTTINRAGAAGSTHAPNLGTLEARLRDITGRLGELEPRLNQGIVLMRGAASRIIEEVAAQISGVLLQGKSNMVSSSDISELLHDAVRRDVEVLISIARNAVTRAIEDSRTVGERLGRTDLPESGALNRLIRDVPQFRMTAQPESILAGFWKHLGASAIHFHVQNRLEGQFKRSLQNELSGYAAAVSEWARTVTRRVSFL